MPCNDPDAVPAHCFDHIDCFDRVILIEKNSRKNSFFQYFFCIDTVGGQQNVSSFFQFHQQRLVTRCVAGGRDYFYFAVAENIVVAVQQLPAQRVLADKILSVVIRQFLLLEIADHIAERFESAGMIGMSKSLAAEVASRNITVNCIAPGFIQSPMTDGLNDKQKEAILATIPAGKLGSGDDIAAALVYLASREAGYVTGQTLHVNGGMAMI